MTEYSPAKSNNQAKKSVSVPKQRFPYFKFYPRDWLEATREMSLEERGAYIDLICLIMDAEGDLRDDEKRIAYQMHISTRKWRPMRDALVKRGKIRIQDGLIIQERCIRELDSLLEQRRTSSESAANRERTKREKSEKPNKNNDASTTVVPLRARVTSDSRLQTEESPPTPDGGARQGALFDGGVGRAAVMAVAAAIAAAPMPAAAAADPPRDHAEQRDDNSAMVEEALRLYGAVAQRRGLSTVKVFNPARRRALLLRLKEADGLIGFRKAMETLDRSSFLHGRSERGWKADFDFVLQAKSFAKLVDGSYRMDLPPSGGAAPSSGFRYAPAADDYGAPIPLGVRFSIENSEREARGEPALEFEDA